MYIGIHHLFLTKDRLLVVPEPFRDLFKYGAFVTRGFENYLWIMSDAFFKEIYKLVLALNIADPAARHLLRLILGNASRLEMKSTGHILIPDSLLSNTGLDKEIILVGQGNYIELWSPEQWQKQSIILLDTEANAERFANLDLALK